MSRNLRTGALALATAMLAGMRRGGPDVAQDPVEVDWWHIHINDPGKSLRQTIADEYMAANPNVQDQRHGPRERGASRPSSRSRCRRATPPDIFQSWGGGVLAEQADAGLVRPIDEEIADWRGHDERRRA